MIQENYIVTNCCEAPFYYPDYPDNDLCTACKEHAMPMKEEEQDVNTYKNE